MSYGVGDAALAVTEPLPAAAGSVTSDGIDLEQSSRGVLVDAPKIKVDAPALIVTELPDDATVTYDLEHDGDPDFGTAAALFPAVIVQTGTGGAGAAAAAWQGRLPVDVKRYVRVKATTADASPQVPVGDCSGKSVSAGLVF